MFLSLHFPKIKPVTAGQNKIGIVQFLENIGIE